MNDLYTPFSNGLDNLISCSSERNIIISINIGLVPDFFLLKVVECAKFCCHNTAPNEVVVQVPVTLLTQFMRLDLSQLLEKMLVTNVGEFL